VEADLAAALAALEAELGRPEGEPERLDGGLTNRNFRVRLGGRDCVVRLLGAGTDLLGIDRATERVATATAAAAGLGPPVLAHRSEPPCLVTRFVPGRVLAAADLHAPDVLEQAAAALRTFHAGPPLPSAFDAFALVERYAATIRRRGGALPDGHDDIAATAERVRAALGGPEHAPVPCHNDLLPANFLHDGARVTILDWEYAGTGDRYFDLGNLAVNAGLDAAGEERLLAAYWREPCPLRRLAALRLMRIMSDFREAMWGYVQAVVSELDIDFAGYGEQHAARLRAALADPRVPDWLEAARGS
jgi:thiamine kinase-like enzyme